MKKSSFRAQAMKRTAWDGTLVCCCLTEVVNVDMMYLVRVIQVHDPRSARADVLVTLALPTHIQRSVHVHVVACEVQAD